MKLIMARILYWLRGLFEDPVALFKDLGVERCDRILEIGCAIGYHTLPLAEIASEGKIVANDVWRKGLAYLQERAGSGDHVEVICESAESIELPPASLDKVICFDTLHEVPDPENAVVSWAEFLKEGGKLLYRDPEITPERVLAFSNGRLRQAGTVRGVHVFVRR
jgi:SAM-dependent methyltransferase